jgi:uncharacterized protein (DUF2147 family)
MNRISRFTALSLLTLAIPALAHGNMDHVLGTVTKISGNVVTIEKDGKSTEVVLASTTEFIVNDKPGKAADLRVGDRVVIHAMKMQGKETAHEVKLVHPAK